MKVPLYLKKMSFTILKEQAKHHLEPFYVRIPASIIGGANIHSTFLRRPYKNNRFQTKLIM